MQHSASASRGLPKAAASLPWATPTLKTPRPSKAGRISCRQAYHRVSTNVVTVAGIHSGREVYQGMFGPWSIEPADEFEVLTYRVGLTATWAGEVFSLATHYVSAPVS